MEVIGGRIERASENCSIRDINEETAGAMYAHLRETI